MRVAHAVVAVVLVEALLQRIVVVLAIAYPVLAGAHSDVSSLPEHACDRVDVVGEKGSRSSRMGRCPECRPVMIDARAGEQTGEVV